MRWIDLRVTAIFLAALLSALNALGAGETTKRRQASIIARVLSYELTLDGRAGEAVGIAVVYKPGNAESESSADDWMRALAELSSVRIKGKSVFVVRVSSDTNDLSTSIEKAGVDVLLVTDGLASASKSIATVARSHHVLTTGSSLSSVEKDFTLCVLEENGKTRIYINLDNAQKEELRFSSNLLKLATLIR